jgi:hypothetical protein
LLQVVEAKSIVLESRKSPVILNIFRGNEFLRVDILHVPLEGFALELFPQHLSMRDIAHVGMVSQIWPIHIQQLRVKCETEEIENEALNFCA